MRLSKRGHTGTRESRMEEEGELLRRLEAELESIRGKKELAIGYDAYAFYCRREKMLVEEIFQLSLQHRLREQRVQAKIET